MGANPDHKDLFIEIDATAGATFPQAAADRIIDAYANAPVDNPDGRPGILVHVDDGPASHLSGTSAPTFGSASEATTGIGIAADRPFGACTHDSSGFHYDFGDFKGVRATNFSQARQVAFTYVLAAPPSRLCFDGIARGIPSNDVIVAGHTEWPVWE